MKYEKLSFIYPFSIGSFLNAKIGLEATLEEGDDYLECFDKLRSDAKRMADIEVGKSEMEEPYPYSGLPMPPSGTYTIKAGDSNGTSNTIGITEESINSCQQLMMLEKVYFPLIDKMKDKEKQRELWIAYDERYAQLKNKEA
jgi:hypothetical protein